MASSPMIGGSDPAILKSLETQTPSVARTAPATVSATTGSATSSGSTVARGLAPQVSGDTLTYNQATQSTSGNSVSVTSSTSNDPGDVVTIYTSPKAVSVSAINQTVNSYKVNNYAGNEYTDSNVANYLPTFTGNVGAGNVNVTGTVYANGLSSTGLASLTTVTISATANLGSVSNVRITGGTNGYVLSTNGSGNLSWVAQSGGGGNGSPGGSNTQIQFNDAGSFGGNSSFTFDSATGNISIPGTIISGNTITIDNRASGNSADINLYSADDILIQARDRNAGSQSEGGDINISAGDSAEDGDSSGGDVTITAGDGGAANIDYGGSGGFITLQSGTGGAASTGANGESALSGGALTLRAGNAGTNNGNIDRGSDGGNVFIEAGDSTGNGLVGGSIFLVTGTGGANAEAGDLQIQVPSSDSGPGGTWRFDGQGVLELPGGGTIRNDGSLDIGGGNAISLEASTVVNIYTDTNGNAYQWQFGDDGNLTLPGNSSSINYANGTPYGGGGSGYIIPYEVATFVANTQPGFGEIQFADNEGANSAPATAQKLFINESPTNEQSLGTIFQQWTSNSYRGTLSLNNGSDSQATFNISNGRIYFNPETYRGFNAGLNQIWGDDCSINQLIITNATAPKFYNTEFLVENDVFHASGLATGNTHVMLNIYGSSQYNPINPNDLWNTFVAFVDNVLYDNTTLRTNPDDIKTQFYNNTGSFRNNIPTQDLYQYFRFTSSSDADYFGTAPTTTNGSGTGATVRIRVNPNNTYTVLGTALPGVGYIGGETLTVLGTDLGGATPANDLTILIASVDGDGVITSVSYDSGTGVYPWPTNRISDGGDDQYDTGNYLNTNLASEISYANGITQTASAAFGGGDYCVMYYQSFFCMVATGVSSSVSDLFYSGDLGFDGDGLLNWTGLRSNQSVIANNNALYAYFDSEYLDGELTPTVGTTYNMTLDSAGINLDGFYAYNDPDSNDHYFGSNTDWRLESQSQLFVQSYNDMLIQTLVNQRGIGETGPTLTVQAGDGSPGQKEINATAGNGGTVNVRGGDAGGSDGIDSLGNTGGSVNITGGVGSGNSQAGNVEINGGEGNNSGSINLRTDYGSNSTGKITLSTGSSGTTNIWEFRPNGSTIFPTLTVDIHNGGNQQAQTLQFGDNTQQAIITGPTPDVTGSAQRLIIQGQRGSGTGEGGDVYLWAGDSDLYGGDIKIYAGDADNVSSGSGGYVNIAGGDGFDGGGYVSMTAGQSSNGAGASASVTGGFGNTVGGEANIRGGGGTVAGGSASILGGYGSGGPGGNVTIIGGGSGNGLAEYGNINLSAGAGTWIFGNDGNLILAGGNSIVRSVANSSLDPINPNISTMVLTPDPGYSSQSLVLDPTSPGHIHLRAPSANIDEPLANIFLGGEDSSFEVGYYNGSAPNVFIHSGGNTWEFLNDGNLVFPRDAVGNTDPFLRITGGASPRILSEDASLAGPANLEITALNTIFTGSSGSAIKIYADDGEIGSTSNLQLWTNSGGNTEYHWTFGDDGNLTTSSNLVISPSGIGTGTAIAQTDAPLQIASTDANGSASIGWYGNPTGPGNVVQVALNQTGGSMTVVTGDYSDTTYVWDFDATGNLTLPTGGELHATGKIGYTSGGTVTQTGTGQGVTLNELTGQITLAKSSWTAGDLEIFNVTCNKVGTYDYVMAQVINGTESTFFNVVAFPFVPVANQFQIQVRALETTTSTPLVQFFIMKAATS